MASKKTAFTKTLLVVNLIIISNITFAQYLRDSTSMNGLHELYPGNDMLILNIYDENEKHHLSFNNIFSIPEVMVEFNGMEFPFLFDFGNSGNITITTAIADSVKYIITDTIYTYTPDGRIRGQVYGIILPEFTTLRQSFEHERGTLSEWSVYSTNPFNGLIGLKYIKNTCFTLSYKRKILAISQQSISKELTKGGQTRIPLEQYRMHPYGVHFKGKVNEHDAIIYFDTGKSQSAINRDLVPSEKIVSDKSGDFYKGTVAVGIGDKSFTIYYPRVKNTRRNVDSNLPVGIEIGSDILKHLLLTIDRTNGQDLLIIH